MDFHVGDRVRLVVEAPDGNDELHIGDEGVVSCVNCELFSRPIGIDFGKDIGGHDLYMKDSRCEFGHGWFVFAGEIELVDDPILTQPPTTAELRSLLGLCRA